MSLDEQSLRYTHLYYICYINGVAVKNCRFCPMEFSNSQPQLHHVSKTSSRKLDRTALNNNECILIWSALNRFEASYSSSKLRSSFVSKKALDLKSGEPYCSSESDNALSLWLRMRESLIPILFCNLIYLLESTVILKHSGHLGVLKFKWLQWKWKDTKFLKKSKHYTTIIQTSRYNNTIYYI